MTPNPQEAVTQWEESGAEDPTPVRKPARETRPQPAVTKISNLLTVLLAVACANLVLSGIPIFRGTPPAKHGWEYKICTIGDNLIKSELEDLGQAGWELVTFRRVTNSFGEVFSEVIFKRPK